MSRYYTLMFIDDDGSSVKRAVISKKLLITFLSFLICILAALTYVFFDYSKLKHTSFQTKRFEKRLMSSRARNESRRTLRTFTGGEGYASLLKKSFSTATATPSSSLLRVM